LTPPPTRPVLRTSSAAYQTYLASERPSTIAHGTGLTTSFAKWWLGSKVVASGQWLVASFYVTGHSFFRSQLGSLEQLHFSGPGDRVSEVGFFCAGGADTTFEIEGEKGNFGGMHTAADGHGVDLADSGFAGLLRRPARAHRLDNRQTA